MLPRLAHSALGNLASLVAPHPAASAIPCRAVRRPNPHLQAEIDAMLPGAVYRRYITAATHRIARARI